MSMVMIIVALIGLFIVLFNSGAFLLIKCTPIRQKVAVDFVCFRLLLSNIAIFLFLIIFSTIMCTVELCTFTPTIKTSECESIRVTGMWKPIYYDSQNESFYTTYIRIDTLAPVKDYRKLNDNERRVLAKYIEDEYERWDEFKDANVDFSQLIKDNK